uniref:Thiaminase I, tandem duplicate 1 n=1 Tax=Maylandia zebra TaxID=106582 RepID=A0A3P9B268_9CICH
YYLIHPFMGLCYEPVNNIDVYEYLWVSNQDIAEHTLHTPCLQHMQLGDLQADNYVKFIIQDINYLVVVTDMLDEMRNKVEVPEDLHDFMEDRCESYKTYAESTLKEFNLNVRNLHVSIINQPLIRFAVALLPCSRLWLWLANQLNENCCSAYFTWKMSNMCGHPEQHYKALLNKYLTTPEQKELANKLFRQQMDNKHDVCASSLE